MTSYFFHVKFELYPSPSPASQNDVSTATDSTQFWLPSSGATIFDDFPSHPTSRRPQAGGASQPRNHEQTPHSSATAGRRSTPSDASSSVIDCGAPRAPYKESGRKTEIISERQWLERTNSYPPPSAAAALRPQTAVRDWRFGQVSIRTVDPPTHDINMAGEASKAGPAAAPTLGPTFSGAGTATKAEYIPKNTELGWGIVHFYREGEETAGLITVPGEGDGDAASSADCATLCIPAVPAYMSSGDFLGYMGERWHNDISHCRMVMTSRMNRYLVLLKFRDGKRAKEFRHEYDGKLFNPVEPQTCHVVFVRSITIETPTRTSTHDHATASTSSAAVFNTLKPFPPPHQIYDPRNPYNQPFGGSASNLCSVCDCADDLWICLLCGYVGCGRYKGGHAKDHWKETAHSFSLELETQYVWDYAGDMWVHRLIRDKGDGKVVELPGRSNGRTHHGGGDEEEDVVPRAKLDTIGLEYTHLITSQLESQRAYYEEMISKAVDKASKASAMAENATAQVSAAMDKLDEVDRRYKTLSHESIPQLERDLERERSKAKKGENLARSLGQALQEEKRLNEGLMKRIEHLGTDAEAVRKQLDELKMENAELKEMNRDLTMFISGQEKLRELENEGKVGEGELEGGR
ncbi:RING fingerETP1-like protein [Cladobotryum mycophilum]|uniref:RING fingerETP1-like protein n=1 Tax=Cladobotryum mycophilum TaxID=491253 RepID=A0ABR0SS48_9HYPO